MAGKTAEKSGFAIKYIKDIGTARNNAAAFYGVNAISCTIRSQTTGYVFKHEQIEVVADFCSFNSKDLLEYTDGWEVVRSCNLNTIITAAETPAHVLERVFPHGCKERLHIVRSGKCSSSLMSTILSVLDEIATRVTLYKVVKIQSWKLDELTLVGCEINSVAANHRFKKVVFTYCKVPEAVIHAEKITFENCELSDVTFPHAKAVELINQIHPQLLDADRILNMVRHVPRVRIAFTHLYPETYAADFIQRLTDRVEPHQQVTIMADLVAYKWIMPLYRLHLLAILKSGVLLSVFPTDVRPEISDYAMPALYNLINEYKRRQSAI